MLRRQINALIHNFIYFKTTTLLIYSLSLILKSKPNILSAKHYFSFLNECCSADVLLPKIFTTTYMIFQSTDINCYKTSKQSSFNFNIQCKSSFIQCTKVHIILKVHLSVKVNVFFLSLDWRCDDIITCGVWNCRLHEVVTLTWWNLKFLPYSFPCSNCSMQWHSHTYLCAIEISNLDKWISLIFMCRL